jgi:hypothetical protein
MTEWYHSPIFSIAPIWVDSVNFMIKIIVAYQLFDKILVSKSIHSTNSNVHSDELMDGFKGWNSIRYTCKLQKWIPYEFMRCMLCILNSSIDGMGNMSCLCMMKWSQEKCHHGAWTFKFFNLSKFEVYLKPTKIFGLVWPFNFASKCYLWSGSMIKIWTRGQNLAPKSTFSELPQTGSERSPRHHEPNAIRFVSNRRHERKI